MERTVPGTANAGKSTSHYTIIADIRHVLLQQWPGQFSITIAAFARQLTDRFLHSQISATVLLGDDTPTIGTGGSLISNQRIRQQMSETSGTHQMAIGALEKKEDKTLLAGSSKGVPKKYQGYSGWNQKSKNRRSKTRGPRR